MCFNQIKNIVQSEKNEEDITYIYFQDVVKLEWETIRNVWNLKKRCWTSSNKLRLRVQETSSHAVKFSAQSCWTVSIFSPADWVQHHVACNRHLKWPLWFFFMLFYLKVALTQICKNILFFHILHCIHLNFFVPKKIFVIIFNLLVQYFETNHENLCWHLL